MVIIIFWASPVGFDIVCVEVVNTEFKNLEMSQLAQAVLYGFPNAKKSFTSADKVGRYFENTPRGYFNDYGRYRNMIVYLTPRNDLSRRCLFLAS